jgi:sugar fermentation stimulation protein A
MLFASPLVPGKLVRRYKRFLADVTLRTGESITAACANTGAMLGLNEPGSTIWLSRSENPARKYPHTWELIEIPSLGLVGVNTGSPNRITAEAIGSGLLPELAGYDSMRAEVKYGRNSRIDLLLESPGRQPCYVERGRKHLHELADMVRSGARAAMVYLVQAAYPDRFSLAEDLDPSYLLAFREARKAGVEAFALCCNVTTTEITANRAVPVQVP